MMVSEFGDDANFAPIKRFTVPGVFHFVTVILMFNDIARCEAGFDVSGGETAQVKF